jgi:oligopeptide transport system permease protein
MGSYVLRRLLMAPVVLLVLATLSFFLMHATPGGPFDAEKQPDPVVKQALMAKYGQDQPLGVQYVRWLGQMARGDFGPSMKQRARTVNEIIGHTLPVSLLLGAVALVLALGVGLALGIIGAVRADTLWDRSAMVLSTLGLGIPPFVVGPILALIFAMYLGWLPVAEYYGPAHPAYLVLPAATLAIPFAARIARLSRAGLLEVLRSDHVRTARAKGASEVAVVLKHALPAGMLPVVGFLGPATAYLLTGSLVVEKIFAIPGLGREFVESVTNRDYTLVMGTVVLYGAVVVVCNLAADLLLGVIDPRVGRS